MRWLVLLGVVVGGFALYGRRGRTDRSELERELQEAARAGVTSLGAIIDDALVGAGQVWDDARGPTGASVWQGGGKGAAIEQTRQSYADIQNRDLLRPLTQ